MTAMEEDIDDRFAGIDIDSLLSRVDRRPRSYGRKQCLYEAPEFTRRLSGEETVMEGQSLCLDCKVDGFPAPSLRWFKDDEEIVDHPRIRVESDGKGRYSLYIDRVNKGDEAAYRCRAENVEGSSSCFFFLSVKCKPRSSRKKRDKNSSKRRSVSFPPMFSTIVEKVEEEDKLGKEQEILPPSPLTDFYYALTLKGRQTWPSFLGDWAFRHVYVGDDDDDNDADGSGVGPMQNGHAPYDAPEGLSGRALMRRNQRRRELNARSAAKRRRRQEEEEQQQEEEERARRRSQEEDDDRRSRSGSRSGWRSRNLEEELKREEEAIERKKQEEKEKERRRREEALRARRLRREQKAQEEHDAKVRQMEEEQREKERLLEEEREREKRREEEERIKKEQLRREEEKRKDEERKREEEERKKEEEKKREEEKRKEEQREKEKEKKKEEQRRKEEEKRKEEQKRREEEKERRLREEEIRKEEQRRREEEKRKEEIRKIEEEKKREEEKRIEEEKQKEQRRKEDEKKKAAREDEARMIEEEKKRKNIEKKKRDDDERMRQTENQTEKGKYGAHAEEETESTSTEHAKAKPLKQKNVLSKFAKFLDESGEVQIHGKQAPTKAPGIKGGSLSVMATANRLKTKMAAARDKKARDKPSTTAVSSSGDLKDLSKPALQSRETVQTDRNIPHSSVSSLEDPVRDELTAEESRTKIREQERLRKDEELRKEERRKEEEENMRKQALEEERLRKEEESREEKRRKDEEEERRKRALEEEHLRKEREMREEERRKDEEDKRRKKAIEEERLRKEEELREEKRRKEEEERKRTQALEEERLRKEEELREKKRRKEEEEKKRIQAIEEERLRKEEALREETRRKDEEERKRTQALEEERLRKEEELREEKMRKDEEEKRKKQALEEERLRKEEKLKEEERVRKEEEKRKERELTLEEERLRKEEQLREKRLKEEKMEREQALEEERLRKEMELKEKIKTRQREQEELQLKQQKEAEQEQLRRKQQQQKEELKRKIEEEEQRLKEKREREQKEERLRHFMKEKIRQEQLQRQYEEEKRRKKEREEELRRRKEEDDKRRKEKKEREREEKRLEIARRAELEKELFEVKIYKRDYSFSDLRKSLESYGGGAVIDPEEHKYWDEILEKHNYSICDLKTVFASHGKERQSRSRVRRNSIEGDASLDRMKRSGSLSDIRDAYTKSLDRPKKNRSEKKKKVEEEDELMKRSSSISDLKQLFTTAMSSSLLDPTESTASGSETVSSETFRDSGVDTSGSQFPAKRRQAPKSSSSTHTELTKLSVNVAAKRASFHELVSQVQQRNAEDISKLKERTRNRASMQTFDSYGSREIPIYKRVSSWRDEAESSRRQDGGLQTPASPPSSQSSSRPMSPTDEDSTSSPRVRPFVYNSIRTIARNDKDKEEDDKKVQDKEDNDNVFEDEKSSKRPKFTLGEESDENEPKPKRRDNKTPNEIESDDKKSKRRAKPESNKTPTDAKKIRQDKGSNDRSHTNAPGTSSPTNRICLHAPLSPDEDKENKGSPTGGVMSPGIFLECSDAENADGSSPSTFEREERELTPFFKPVKGVNRTEGSTLNTNELVPVTPPLNVADFEREPTPFFVDRAKGGGHRLPLASGGDSSSESTPDREMAALDTAAQSSHFLTVPTKPALNFEGPVRAPRDSTPTPFKDAESPPDPLEGSLVGLRPPRASTPYFAKEETKKGIQPGGETAQSSQHIHSLPSAKAQHSKNSENTEHDSGKRFVVKPLPKRDENLQQESNRTLTKTNVRDIKSTNQLEEEQRTRLNRENRENSDKKDTKWIGNPGEKEATYKHKPETTKTNPSTPNTSNGPNLTQTRQTNTLSAFKDNRSHSGQTAASKASHETRSREVNPTPQALTQRNTIAGPPKSPVAQDKHKLPDSQAVTTNQSAEDISTNAPNKLAAPSKVLAPNSGASNQNDDVANRNSDSSQTDAAAARKAAAAAARKELYMQRKLKLAAAKVIETKKSDEPLKTPMESKTPRQVQASAKSQHDKYVPTSGALKTTEQSPAAKTKQISESSALASTVASLIKQKAATSSQASSPYSNGVETKQANDPLKRTTDLKSTAEKQQLPTASSHKGPKSSGPAEIFKRLPATTNQAQDLAAKSASAASPAANQRSPTTTLSHPTPVQAIGAKQVNEPLKKSTETKTLTQTSGNNKLRTSVSKPITERSPGNVMKALEISAPAPKDSSTAKQEPHPSKLANPTIAKDTDIERSEDASKTSTKPNNLAQRKSLFDSKLDKDVSTLAPVSVAERFLSRTKQAQDASNLPSAVKQNTPTSTLTHQTIASKNEMKRTDEPEKKSVHSKILSQWQKTSDTGYGQSSKSPQSNGTTNTSKTKHTLEPPPATVSSLIKQKTQTLTQANTISTTGQSQTAPLSTVSDARNNLRKRDSSPFTSTHAKASHTESKTVPSQKSATGTSEVASSTKPVASPFLTTSKSNTAVKTMMRRSVSPVSSTAGSSSNTKVTTLAAALKYDRRQSRSPSPCRPAVKISGSDSSWISPNSQNRPGVLNSLKKPEVTPTSKTPTPSSTTGTGTLFDRSKLKTVQFANDRNSKTNASVSPRASVATSATKTEPAKASGDHKFNALGRYMQKTSTPTASPVPPHQNQTPPITATPNSSLRRRVNDSSVYNNTGPAPYRNKGDQTFGTHGAAYPMSSDAHSVQGRNSCTAAKTKHQTNPIYTFSLYSSTLFTSPIYPEPRPAFTDIRKTMPIGHRLTDAIERQKAANLMNSALDSSVSVEENVTSRVSLWSKFAKAFVNMFINNTHQSKDNKRTKSKNHNTRKTRDSRDKKVKYKKKKVVIVPSEDLTYLSPFGRFTLEGILVVCVMTFIALSADIRVEVFICYVLAAYYTFFVLCVLRILE